MNVVIYVYVYEFRDIFMIIKNNIIWYKVLVFLLRYGRYGKDEENGCKGLYGF